MKAEELRVGCIALRLNDNQAYEEHLIHHFDISYLVENEDTPIYKPIKLTPEWLKRMGFKSYSGMYYQNRVIVHENMGAWMVLLGEQDEKTNIQECAITIIFNVHQLQNLYFALTGLEIEIKQHETITI